jgi:ethanolaminephosphotransferase
MWWTINNVLLAAANALIPIAVFTFATGFFPYKPFVPGLATYQQLNYGDPPDAQFDKVVFMVVDALRSDFVFSKNSGFKFTQRSVTLLHKLHPPEAIILLRVTASRHFMD